MMRTKPWFSISRKIFFAMLVISMIPISLLFYFSRSITYSAMHKQLVDGHATSMDWLYDRLTLEVRSFSDQFYEFEVDKDLKNSLISWAHGEELDHVGQTYMRQSFETALAINPAITSIEVYNLSSGEGYISMRAGFRQSSGGTPEALNERQNSNLQTNLIFKSDGDGLLALHQVNDFASGKGVAVIIMRFRAQTFAEVLNKVKGEPDETVYLLNDEDEVLFESSGEIQDLDIVQLLSEQNGESGKAVSADRYFSFYKSVSNGKLQVIHIVPNEVLVQTLQHTTFIGIVIIICALLADLLLSLVFSRLISHPIVRLSEKMQVTNIQSFNESEVVERHDEIGYLQSSFQQMILRNQELIDKGYRSELEKRNAQIRALQAQINPHFLYNTLQVIGGMSLKGQTEDIYPAITALSDILRYSFSFSQETVPLEKEIEYLRSYLSIQNYRFDSRISLTVEIPDHLLDAFVPKLILQPILENSFKHGFDQKSGEWKIGIRAQLDESGEALIITAQDNGSGIDDERLEEIKAQLASGVSDPNRSNHIGLSNVHLRLILRYGEQYGVQVESRVGIGTTVTIITKLIWEV